MEQFRSIIIAAMADRARVRRLSEQLAELGVHIDTFDNMLKPGEGFTDQIKTIISREKVIIIFVSENSIKSQYVTEEIKLAYQSANERLKKIITIVEWKSILDNNPEIAELIKNGVTIFPEDGLHSKKDLSEAAARIYDIIADSESKELLYEKITSLSKIDYKPGVCTNLSKLIMLLCSGVQREQNAAVRRETYKEILRCVEQLWKNCGCGYSKEDKQAAHDQLDALKSVHSMISAEGDFRSLDLFLIAYALKINFITYDIHMDAVDTLSNGDVLFVESIYKEYVQREEDFYELYGIQTAAQRITATDHGRYPKDEAELILGAGNYLIDEGSGPKPARQTEEKQLTEKEKQLYEIAGYMRQSNKLFELAGDKSLAIDFLKCLKTSYERLRRYSEIVGCVEICAECIEQIAEINQKLENTDGEQSDGSTAETGFKALLGFSLSGVDDFDVFISYKHEDGDIASGIYHFLKSNLINPFYDTVSLPELSKSEYEDAIMAALEHSRHFIVVLSKLEYLNSHWVDLEMKTFRHEMVEGRKPDANFIIIVTDDIYKQIVETNKLCLPIKYRSYEIMRLIEYKDSLLQYLK